MENSTADSLPPETAIVTHKGAAADAGHYMAFVKKSVFHSTKSTTSPSSGASGASTEFDEDDDWYKFDDDQVSIFPKEKLATLDGGGAYLFYMILDHPSHTPCRRRLSRICFIVSRQASCVNEGFHKEMSSLVYGDLFDEISRYVYGMLHRYI